MYYILVVVNVCWYLNAVLKCISLAGFFFVVVGGGFFSVVFFNVISLLK